MMPICNRFIVSGKVQGVFFRASTRDQALRLGISGWVRNLSTGDVELLAYGDRDSIEELGQWLWHGPKYAKVTDVKSVHLSDISSDTPKGFDVREDG